MDRTALLASALKQAFQPLRLAINDDSGKHAGHQHGGGGHFSVSIASHHFEGKSLLERHRMIYRALGDLMPGEIHALSIKALAPTEERA